MEGKPLVLGEYYKEYSLNYIDELEGATVKEGVDGTGERILID